MYEVFAHVAVVITSTDHQLFIWPAVHVAAFASCCVASRCMQVFVSSYFIDTTYAEVHHLLSDS